jgi:hypothetical protein
MGLLIGTVMNSDIKKCVFHFRVGLNLDSFQAETGYSVETCENECNSRGLTFIVWEQGI